MLAKANRTGDEASAATVGEHRADFYERAKLAALAPLWSVLKGLVPKQPESMAKPAIWHYGEVRPYLLEACDLIGTEEAERRVLMLENPAISTGARITGSLYAGLQVIKPGETAPCHRHAASALRFIIEGAGGWTAVNGERTFMSPGDFVVTPAWQWHEHGNDGDGPVVWLDCLDIHIVNLLDCGFREDTAECPALLSRPPGASMFETGMNMLPMDVDRSRVTSPIFNYPYVKTREALGSIRRFRPIDPYVGFKLRYTNPLNGDWAIATIATWMQLLPQGFSTEGLRSTDGTVYVIVEGDGHSLIGDIRVDWTKGDVFAVPSWTMTTHHASTEAVLFGASDRATQEKLGLWREQRPSNTRSATES
jgi:gentisate 1,2-dioxygenase